MIFVHELGHFIVAKLCGVKCEKFYLGFDVGGWKLFKFKYGETEYGIGVLPLGGYVKMLGQEDNPARLRAEIERAKLQRSEEGASADTSTETPIADQSEKEFDMASAEQALYDPRSYLAKSVPKRMAIISAGVIMNVIFAFFTAVAAYYIGVEQIACGVGEVFPGEAAWRAGLRPGDQIVEIAGKKVDRFEDLKMNVTVGDIDNGVAMTVKRPGIKDPLKFLVHPDLLHGYPSIGIFSSRIATLEKEPPKEVPPCLPGSAAFRAKPALQPGDRIVMADDVKVDGLHQLNAYLAMHPDKPLQLTIECTLPAENQKNNPLETSKLINVAVPPQPMRRLGLVMTMGQIAAIQDGSPAAAAGIKARDLLLKIDGKPVDDPMLLPDQLRRRAGETITLTIGRESLPAPIDVTVTLRQVGWIEQPQMENNPLTVPELGIAYQVLNRVDRVIPGSPAEKAGIQPGEIIQQATIFPPDDSVTQKSFSQSKITIDFDEKNQNWPFFFYLLQGKDYYPFHPGSTVELVFNNDRKVMLKPENVPDWYNPYRGFIFEPETNFRKAQSFTQAVQWGGVETQGSLMAVARFLQKLGSQISVKALGGPITIAVVAGQAAKQGIARLLLFLTFLSANLAVLNLLPIPLLDGGHLIFLIYEGIRGKPADERVQIALSLLGLVFLLGLMLFVIGMDVSRLIFFFK